MLAITAKMVSDLSTAVTGVVTEDAEQTLTNKTLTAPAISSPTVSGAWDGWISAGETWAYASATTITVPSGAASRYQKGDKIKITNNSTTKYFYIRSVADTVLTVTGGTDYTVHDSAISAPYYSKESNPHGFPQSFAWTPTLSVSGGTVPTYSSSYSRFAINGNLVTLHIALTNVSGGTAGAGVAEINCNLPVSSYANVNTIGTGVAYEQGGTMGAVFCRSYSTGFYFHTAAFANITGDDQSSAARQLHFHLSYIMA
jgi:hypothetical protein